jgi:hypothetical protein
MQFKPALSRRQRAIFASLAIVASGTTLFLSISPAAPPSPEQDAIAVANEQRLQATLDEARRPGADFRLCLGQRLRPRMAEPAGTAVSGAPAKDETDPATSTKVVALKQVC